MDDDEQQGFKWETAYTEGLGLKNVLDGGEERSLQDSIQRIVDEAKRKRRNAEHTEQIKLGIMRYIYVCLDLSASMLSQEFYFNRMKATIDCLNGFLEKFFELNPLSQIGVITCRDKHSERIQGFTSDSNSLKRSLSTLSEGQCSGEFSLNSTLRLALHSFQGLPAHTSKEILIVTASLSTIDAGSLIQTFERLKMFSIRCSVISLAAEVFVFKKLCSTTTGTHSVVLSEQHMEVLLNTHLHPPPYHKQQKPGVMRMGFPSRKLVETVSFCMCHEPDFGQSTEEKERGSKNLAFFCPQCNARYCQTPVECRICGLLLLTAPQLARAHQHLQQLPQFTEINISERKSCFACDEYINAGQKGYVCNQCHEEFCIDCDLLLHESLQVCPGCTFPQ